MPKTIPTPGPWTVTQQREFYHDHPQPLQIWRMTDEPEDCRFLARMSDDWSDEQKANAQLMAAAPDLLAALEESMQFVAKWANDHDSQIGFRMVDRMQAAIDKAEGESIHV